MNLHQTPIAFFTGCMTFSWMIVWVSFITAPILGKRFSLLDALASFILAAVIAAGSRNYRLRNYQMIGLHLVGMTIMLARSFYISFFSTEDFFSNIWLDALASKVGNLNGFLTVLLVVVCIIAFWWAGAKLGRKSINYMVVCNRFDFGLTSLFALLLIQFILVTRGGLSIAAPPDAFYVYSFFLCGLSAIGLARHDSAANRKFLPGLRGIAALLLMVFVMLAATGVMAKFAPPVLAPMAEDGYVVVKTVARPLGSIITRFLVFIFRRDFDYKAEMHGTSGSTGDLLPAETNSWGFWLARLLAEGLTLLLFVGAMVIFGFALWRLVRWLMVRAQCPAITPRQRSKWAEILYAIWIWLHHQWRAIKMQISGPVHIGHLFAALQIWGRFGGVGRNKWETPEEYANRLSARFPQLNKDIHTIVGFYQHHFYGERKLDIDSLIASYAAWRRLKSPQHWPARWRALFDRPQSP